LCCFSTNVNCCWFRYRLCPETFGYTLVYVGTKSPNLAAYTVHGSVILKLCVSCKDTGVRLTVVQDAGQWSGSFHAPLGRTNPHPPSRPHPPPFRSYTNSRPKFCNNAVLKLRNPCVRSQCVCERARTFCVSHYNKIRGGNGGKQFCIRWIRESIARTRHRERNIWSEQKVLFWCRVFGMESRFGGSAVGVNGRSYIIFPCYCAIWSSLYMSLLF